jgi:FlaG/FlaF family flagellin (archaellin)
MPHVGVVVRIAAIAALACVIVVEVRGPVSGEVKTAKPARTLEMARDSQRSCRDFVQRFYDWYVPIALKDNAGNPSDRALRYKSHAFSPELLTQLKEDSTAQAKAKGEIVGLDFDPFLNSQHPGERYTAEKVVGKRDRC